MKKYLVILTVVALAFFGYACKNEQNTNATDTGATATDTGVSSTSSTDRTRAAIQARRGTIEAMQNRVRVALRQMRRERARVTVAAVARRADVVGPPGAAARSRIWQIGP